MSKPGKVNRDHALWLLACEQTGKTPREITAGMTERMRKLGKVNQAHNATQHPARIGRKSREDAAEGPEVAATVELHP